MARSVWCSLRAFYHEVVVTSCIRVQCYFIIARNVELRKCASSRQRKQYKPQLARYSCPSIQTQTVLTLLTDTHFHNKTPPSPPKSSPQPHQSCLPNTRARTPSTSPSRLRRTSTPTRMSTVPTPTQQTPSTALASVIQVRSSFDLHS